MNPGDRKRVQVNLGLEPDVAERLGEAAKERGLSQGYLASRLIGEALDRLLPVDEVRWTRQEEASDGR